MRGNTETSLTAPHPSSKWHHYRLRNRKFGEFGEKSEKKIEERPLQATLFVLKLLSSRAIDCTCRHTRRTKGRVPSLVGPVW